MWIGSGVRVSGFGVGYSFYSLFCRIRYMELVRFGEIRRGEDGEGSRGRINRIGGLGS